MTKAFSLLELIIVIAIIAVILTFSIPKFSNLIEKSKITELKSNLAIIRNNISKLKTKQVLLNETVFIDSLDDASSNINNQILFDKVIDFNILSTNSSIKEIGKWIKLSDTSYKYILSSNKSVEFSLEENSFNCVSSFEICKEIE